MFLVCLLFVFISTKKTISSNILLRIIVQNPRKKNNNQSQTLPEPWCPDIFIYKQHYMILRNAGFLTWLRRPSRSRDFNPCSTCKPLDMDTEHTAQPRHSHGNRDGYIIYIPHSSSIWSLLYNVTCRDCWRVRIYFTHRRIICKRTQYLAMHS